MSEELEIMFFEVSKSSLLPLDVLLMYGDSANGGSPATRLLQSQTLFAAAVRV
jgi:hypothetical protein